MSTRSSTSPHPTPLPPMLQLARASYSHFAPSPIYPTHTLSPPHTRHSPPPPDLMRRGVKRTRSQDSEEDDRQTSGSDTDGNPGQATVLPAPKKRTRTLMTPDQLTALHRLLSMTRFPTTEQREQCGREIGLSARRVQVWFQNQRQKSKAQQQAASQAGSSRLGLAPRMSGPYQVFSYDSVRYDPPRPYSSPHPYALDEPRYPHLPAPSPRRSSRLEFHRRGSSSVSYSGQRAYPPTSYSQHPMEDLEFSPYYERRQSPEHSGSPEVSRHARDDRDDIRDDHSVRDDTLAPIWPENGPESSRTAQSRSPVAALLPTGLPPPQPLEPTPLWNHPHTSPRYMRPLPPTHSLSSLLGSLNRGRARSDPPIGSHPAPAHGRPRPSLGLGLQLTGIRPSENPDAHEDAPSPERTASDPVRVRAYSPVEPARPHTSRGTGSHSRRSSQASQQD